jgi:integrase
VERERMSTSALLPLGPAAASPLLVPLVESARSYAEQSRARATRDAYTKDWRAFSSWCEARHLDPHAVEVVAVYLGALADSGRAVGGIARVLAALCHVYTSEGLRSPREAPAVRDVWAGIRRAKGTAPVRKAPLVLEALRDVVLALPASLRGTRDRALLLLGWATAARRSELVALDVADLRVTREGLEVLIRRSKTDQEAEGRKIGVPFGSNPSTCPVRAVRAWLDAAGITDGAIFRGVTRHGRVTPHRLDGRDVARIVKRAAGGVEALGVEVHELAGHSLRSGFVTSAIRAGKADRAVMRQTGHRSRSQLDRYVREAEIFRDNAAGGIGL